MQAGNWRQHCVRVREGGDVLGTVDLDRGRFACALGRPGRQTLYILATEWNGPQNMFKATEPDSCLPSQRRSLAAFLAIRAASE